MSRIFQGCIEAQKEIKRDLFHTGIQVKSNSYQNKDVKDNEDFDSTEIQGYSYIILNFDDLDDLDRLALKWCMAEHSERISSKYVNPGNAYKLRRDLWGQFLNDKGEFDYSYNERIRVQIREIIDE